jgi:uncharacterized protein (DUF2141 family)
MNVSLAQLSAALLAMISTSSSAQSVCEGREGSGKVRLSVSATGIRASKGEYVVTLYPDDRSRFLAKGGKLARVRVPARAPVTTVCFWVPRGRYAIATYHDENGDRKFNRTLFSVKEGYGFSKDASTSLGLPQFERVRFQITTNEDIRITTRYPD